MRTRCRGTRVDVDAAVDPGDAGGVARSSDRASPGGTSGAAAAASTGGTAVDMVPPASPGGFAAATLAVVWVIPDSAAVSREDFTGGAGGTSLATGASMADARPASWHRRR